MTEPKYVEERDAYRQLFARYGIKMRDVEKLPGPTMYVVWEEAEADFEAGLCRAATACKSFFADTQSEPSPITDVDLAVRILKRVHEDLYAQG